MDIEKIIYKMINRNGKPLGIERNYSVLVPLIEINNKIHILFEVRSKNLKTQPGEISFPGGMVEEGEEFSEAAIRETCEELNINNSNIKLIGELDYIVTPFNISIYPYLAIIENIDLDEINFNKDEVESILTVPLDYFLNNNPLKYSLYINPNPEDNFPFHLIPKGKAYNWRTGTYSVYFYEYLDNIIWGITARITKNFIDIIKK